MDDSDPSFEDLYDHLVATEELPVEREAGHWLGEAQAVAADLRGRDADLRARDADPETRRERLATVVDLLDEFESTGNPDADAHVARAREIADRLCERAANETSDESNS